MAAQLAEPWERRSLIVAVVEPPLEIGQTEPPHLRVRLKADDRSPQVGKPVEFLTQIENKGQTAAVGFAVAFRPSQDVPFQVIAPVLDLAPGSLMELNWEYAFAVPGPYKAEVEIQNVPLPHSDFVRIAVQ